MVSPRFVALRRQPQSMFDVLPTGRSQRARPRTEPVMAFLERYGTIGVAWWGTSSRTVATTSSSISADGCPISLPTDAQIAMPLTRPTHIGRSGAGSQRLEPLQRLGSAAQPEVHRLPGVEPEGPQAGPQPSQPHGSLDLVRRAGPPRHRRSPRVRGGAGQSGSQRALPQGGAGRTGTAHCVSRVPLPGHPALRDLRLANVGEPPEEGDLLLLPALPPALQAHPRGPSRAPLHQRGQGE